MKDGVNNFGLQIQNIKELWSLDPDINFLNHGSFGACPKSVLSTQQQLRARLEAEPVRFFTREWESLLDYARNQLADFIGGNEQNLVFVSNATTGVNAVLRSLQFSSDDELLTTNHEYNACRNALDFVANRSGARVTVAKIPFPLESPQEVIKAVLEQLSPKTKLALLDHITSQTGLILPIPELVQELQLRGVDTLIDGSHAPGMIALNVSEIAATYYVGNCHKWLCAPKGAAFLYVQKDKQSMIRPLTISHGANSLRRDKSLFQLEFDWMGTDDPTAYICVPEAIKLMGSLLPGGWEQLRQHNHELVLQGRKLLCDILNVFPPCPKDMIGSMAVIPMPQPWENQDFVSLHDRLLDDFGIELPFIPWQGQPKLLMRISAQIYNSIEEYEYLAKVLRKF
ncbi:MAG: aminotransferase class V-fold PLP-dependent enzyme [Richelia sp.]|nr:aminotransferase class V-fold PLP-dependent enzyme [Richelia sp.]CDN11945.1 putative isopenicillin n epimerase protein [Richelia intracellularis]